MILKNGNKKLIEKTQQIAQVNINMIFKNLQQQGLLVIVFILVKLIR